MEWYEALMNGRTPAPTRASAWDRFSPVFFEQNPEFAQKCASRLGCSVSELPAKIPAEWRAKIQKSAEWRSLAVKPRKTLDKLELP
jgi:hypothetical protein